MQDILQAAGNLTKAKSFHSFYLKISSALQIPSTCSVFSKSTGGYHTDETLTDIWTSSIDFSKYSVLALKGQGWSLHHCQFFQCPLNNTYYLSLKHHNMRKTEIMYIYKKQNTNFMYLIYNILNFKLSILSLVAIK